jgi:hypothetical protein
VHNKLDKMCGMPKGAVLYFNRQDIKDGDQGKRNDETLGMYLEDLAANAKHKKCRTCHLEMHHHSQEIYHRDGQLQITIKPSLLATQTENHQPHTYGFGSRHHQASKNQANNKDSSYYVDQSQDMPIGKGSA